jgi:NTE family protein
MSPISRLQQSSDFGAVAGVTGSYGAITASGAGPLRENSKNSLFIESMTQMPRINKHVPGTEKGKTALFLGGGAPNFTLMSGALLALLEARIPRRFDIISMAGAGAVVGLIYLAPKAGLSKQRALKNTVNFGISDAIYEMLPINYKTFAKSGPSADAFNEFWFSLPIVREAMRMHDRKMSDREKLWADWLLFLGAAMCPTDLNFFSKGVCEHPRFIEEFIDLEKVRKIRTKVEINAFDIKKHGIHDFTNGDLARRPKDTLRAALSFPFIYPPHELDGRQYYEGAAFQTLNQLKSIEQIERFIILNPLRSNLIQAPDNLWDAYIQSIIMPVVGIAESEVGSDRRVRPIDVSWMYYRGALEQIRATLQRVDRQTRLGWKQKFERMEWYSAELKIDDDDVPDALGWKRSSLENLFNFGHRAGKKLVTRLRNKDPVYSGRELARFVCD